VRGRDASVALVSALALAACAATDTSTTSATDTPTTSASRASATIAFERIQISADFTCEGAAFTDLDRDGDQDVIAGPYWHEGPDFSRKHALYEPKVFDPKGYSDAFFTWPEDFDGDGYQDLLYVTFPGRWAAWYRNPLGDPQRGAGHWERHEVLPSVDNESPAFVDVTGDGRRELVFHTGRRFGWAGPDPADPTAPWTFHPLSREFELGPFVHGLGVGDVDGDGRLDVLWRAGWFRQPPVLEGDPEWEFHAHAFGDRYGGAQMHVDDVDGDGDGDVITSLAAHHFGLAWFEQVRTSDGISFVEHRFMDDEPIDSPHGVRFGELHALDLCDVDGDGALDIVTGKRWWSHGAEGDPEPGSKPVVYWFQRARTPDGVDWVPHLVDDDSGVGVALATGDVDGDALPDVVVGNKRGVFVLAQRRSIGAPVPAAGAEKPTFDFESGDLRGWTISGHAFVGQPIEGDAPGARQRESSLHAGARWIGGFEKVGDGPTGSMTSAPFAVEAPWASFLVGGGGDASTRVEVVLAQDQRVLFRTSGAYYESMQRVSVDLSAHVGRPIFLRLVDESSGGWGHVNFDDFRFHAEEPRFERPAGVPAILVVDEVLHAGLAADEAARAMQLATGARVEVVAAEPELHQPIALAVDDRGRLWVAEAFEYPTRAEGDVGRDDVVVFEDKDGDGRHETRTVFLAGLNLVSGLEVGYGGAWIGAAPYLWFVPDADGDLVPDGPPQKVLDGWAFDDTHETLNAFNWGPDGWLYGCHGVFTHSRVGAPGTPDSERTPIDAGVWRFDPRTRRFEVFAWGTSNPWGVDFDQHGQCLITACVIPHLWHMVQGGRYQRQGGSHFDAYAYDEIETIADHRHYLGADPHGGNLRSNSAGGGHAHCGALVALGSAFPPAWRGNVLMGNIHGNRIVADRLERSGSGFVGRHADNYLVANDKWFRAIALEEGADGAVYLIDWYDQQACHLTTPESWDRTNGRLYRVAFGPRVAVPPDLAAQSSRELVAALASEREWLARHALRLLHERGPDPALHAELARGVRDGADDVRRLRSLWALGATGGLDEVLARQFLAAPDEDVVAWTVQLLLEDRSVEPATLAELVRLARASTSARVRLYLASALQRLPVADRWELAAALLARGEDAADQNIPCVLWYGVEPLVPLDPGRALRLASEARIERVARHLVRRAGAEPALHAELVRALAARDNAPHRGWMLAEFQAGIGDQRRLPMPPGWAELRAQLARDPSAEVRDLATALAAVLGDPASFPALRARLADGQQPFEARVAALEGLARGGDPALCGQLRGLLDDEALRGDVLRALVACDDPAVAAEVLARWPTFSPDERRDALNLLSSRRAWAAPLLDALAVGTIARGDVGAFVVRKIENLGDPALVTRVAEVWGRVQATPEAKRRRIDDLKSRLTQAALAGADLPRGRDLYARTCQQCHALFERGGNVGPELTGANRSDLEYLLSNAIDPNAVVAKDYWMTVLSLDDGRLVTGIQVASTPSSITLRAENEDLVVARDEIEESRVAEISLMPEGLLDALGEDEVRDLVAYLQSPKQVPRLATPVNAGEFFDGKSLAGWRGADCWSVSDGEIVGRTAGLPRNEFLRSELELRDFSLSLEVRLVGDEGNSGIQFRSSELEDGEMVGYQADVGPGWWGALYEENARGLLAAATGEEHAVKDGWNRYVIEARGRRVRTWINGQACVDLDDPAGAVGGIVALQIHSGGATEVRFRNLVLEVFEPAVEPAVAPR